MPPCLPGGLVIGLVGLVAAAAREGSAAAGPGRAVATIDMPTPLLFGQVCFFVNMMNRSMCPPGEGRRDVASHAV